MQRCDCGEFSGIDCQLAPVTVMAVCGLSGPESLFYEETATVFCHGCGVTAMGLGAGCELHGIELVPL